MNLQTKISNDLKQAIIDRNKERSDLLKVVVAELSRYPTKEVSDEDVLKKLKMMKEGAIACNNTSELEILEEYMPAMWNEEEVKTYVKGIISLQNLSGVKDLGKVMAFIKNSGIQDQIDNKIASKYAKQFLTE